MNKKGEYKFLVADHDTDLVQVVRVSSSRYIRHFIVPPRPPWKHCLFLGNLEVN